MNNTFKLGDSFFFIVILLIFDCTNKHQRLYVSVWRSTKQIVEPRFTKIIMRIRGYRSEVCISEPFFILVQILII